MANIDRPTVSSGRSGPSTTLAPAARLGSLLVKIRDGLRQFPESLQLAQDSDSGLPDIKVHSDDIDAAVLYLAEFGLKPDAIRRKAEWDRCVWRCVGEWLSATTDDDEPEEFRDWLHAFYGPIPAHGSPNDPVVVDRWTNLLGHVVGLSQHVEELISSVTALSEAQPDATDDNGHPPATKSQPPPDAVGVEVKHSPQPFTSPPTAKEHLASWREILIALGMRNNSEGRQKVGRLNETYNGPIKKRGQGKQPFADKVKLLEWWNGLEEMVESQANRARDTKETVKGTHAYGREGEVVPEISGSVKRRRRDRQP